VSNIGLDPVVDSATDFLHTLASGNLKLFTALGAITTGGTIGASTGGGGVDMPFSGSTTASNAIANFGPNAAWVEIPAAAGIQVLLHAPASDFAYAFGATQPAVATTGFTIKGGSEKWVTVTTRLWVRGLNAQSMYVLGT
jgi:hypothetical protein